MVKTTKTNKDETMNITNSKFNLSLSQKLCENEFNDIQNASLR